MSPNKTPDQGRYILRFRGQGVMPEADRARIRALPGLVVVDNSSPRMLLVEAPPEKIKALVGQMPGWNLTAEKFVPLPDLRPKMGSSSFKKRSKPL